MLIGAYVSRDRLEGRSVLNLVTEDKRGKSLTIHSFILYFDYRGIKEYKYEKYYCSLQKIRGFVVTRDYCCLETAEAAVLLQDAYGQNKHPTPSVCIGIKRFKELLEYDTSEVDMYLLLEKIYRRCFTPEMIVNAFLTAIRKMDYPLIHYLSTFTKYDNLDWGIVIKSEATYLTIEDELMHFRAVVYSKSSDDKIIKINYHIKLAARNGRYVIENFQETNWEELIADHPDNPLNYKVFCLKCNMKKKNEFIKWLEEHEEIFITGEFNGGICYKWLKNTGRAWEKFDITDGIKCEFIIQEDKLYIYAQKAHELAIIESSLVKVMGGIVTFESKYLIPIYKLYRLILSHKEHANISQEKELSVYEAKTAIAHLKDGRSIYNLLCKKAKYRFKFSKRTWYFYCEEEKGTAENNTCVEYYYNSNWMKIIMYTGEIVQEINQIKLNLDEIFYWQEFGSSDSSLSEHRKWHIYKNISLMNKEFKELKDTGVIPSVRGVAVKMGAVNC